MPKIMEQEAVYPVSINVFDALGIYLTNYSFELFGTLRPEYVATRIEQLARMNRVACYGMFPTEPSQWLELDNYRFSMTSSLFKELVNELPHYNRKRAHEALRYINDSVGALKTESDQELLKELENRLRVRRGVARNSKESVALEG